jgi:hypothetical protein
MDADQRAVTGKLGSPLYGLPVFIRDDGALPVFIRDDGAPLEIPGYLAKSEPPLRSPLQ